MKVCKNRKLV